MDQNYDPNLQGNAEPRNTTTNEAPAYDPYAPSSAYDPYAPSSAYDPYAPSSAYDPYITPAINPEVKQKATLTLVFGIVAISGAPLAFSCFGVVAAIIGVIAGILALVFAKQAKGTCEPGQKCPGSVTVGNVLAIIGLILSALFIIGWLVYFLFCCLFVGLIILSSM